MFRGFGDEELTRETVRPGTVRRILPYARPYRWSIAALLVLTVFDAAVTAASPFLLKVIIDRGVLPRDTGIVVGVACGVAGLALLEALLILVQRWYSARIGEGLIYDLRVKVFAHVQRQPLAFFTRAQTGSLVSRLNSDVIEAQQAVTSILSQVLSSVLSVVLVLGAMFYLSWQVTLVSLVLLPLFVVLTRVVGRRLQRLTRESMQLNAEMGSMMNERFNVAGAMLVKLYGRPAEESRLFASRSGRVRDINVVAAVYGRVLFVALTLLAALGTAMTYGVGGMLAVHRTIEIGSLVALATLLTRLYGPITNLANVQVSVMTALVSFDRVFEVLDLEPVVAERPDAVALEVSRDPAPEIEFSGVSFRYPAPNEVSLASLESIALPAGERVGPSAQVLDGVGFRAPAGRLTALVGPTGAGKTTITHLVSRLYDPTSGTVRIGGRDIREATLDSLRESIGVVTQDAHMFHDTIRANLLYARPEASEDDLVEACRAAQIWDLIESLPHGLDTVVGDRGYRLSGGEKQRVSLARLLLKAPPIVVLDEATAHLDSESEAAVQRALAAALRGRTSLVIAHRLSTIREADQILVVDGGRIAEHGTHEELIARGGLYSELYRTQYAGQENGRFTAPPEQRMTPEDREPRPADPPGEKFFVRRQV
ncbi:ABC transporter ATP-binding protein [Spirillospora sp. NPDC052269]